MAGGHRRVLSGQSGTIFQDLGRSAGWASAWSGVEELRG